MFDLNNYKDNIAIITENCKWTYSNLWQVSNSFARAINERCLIFILCGNNVETIVGYIGCVNNKIVPLLISSEMNEKLIEEIQDVYKPHYLWVPANRKSLFQKFNIVIRIGNYVLLDTGQKNIYPLNIDLGVLMSTSGSTGSPKFVRISYENIKVNTKSIVEYLSIDNSERSVTSLPLNYVYGLSILNTHIYMGASLVVTDKNMFQREFWELVKDNSITNLAGVPYTYEMLDKLRFYRMDLPRLHTLTQAGGKLLPELQEKFARYAEENGKKFVVMYGAAEATARMGYLPPEMAVRKKGAMGVAIPGGKFSLIDEDGKEIIEPNITGELVYTGKNVTLGYAECGEDLIKGDERNGVLYTGDMARFDEDGFYYIVGRKKRFLKIYGNRVNLDEIERLIKGKFSIEAATTGMDDHLYIFVTVSKYVPEIKSFIVSLTKLNQAAFKVAVIDEIPKNSSGKPLYNELMKFVQAR